MTTKLLILQILKLKTLDMIMKNFGIEQKQSETWGGPLIEVVRNRGYTVLCFPLPLFCISLPVSTSTHRHLPANTRRWTSGWVMLVQH